MNTLAVILGTSEPSSPAHNPDRDNKIKEQLEPLYLLDFWN
jgi:hypothetical protein